MYPEVDLNIMSGGNGTNRLDGLAHYGREWDGQLLHPHLAA